MADYFQDITPPNKGTPPPAPREPLATPSTTPAAAPPSEGERSIRNIPVSPSRPRPRVGAGEVKDASPSLPPQSSSYRLWMWGAAALALIILGAIALVALRPTTISVIPRSQMVLFDEALSFTAYPAATAVAGTLPYTLDTRSFEDSEIVVAEGTERVEEKASGSVTVYNEYSAQPVKLLKNTRFQSPDGLIFRSPAEVLVPGKKGTLPGTIDITVFAEEPGEKYNVGPVSRFTLPGLKTTPDIYTKVYASSKGALSGGFAGERPKAAPGVLQEARAQIRTRLEEKIRASVSEEASGNVAFVELARVTYVSMPPGSEGNKVRIGERATVELPLFPRDAFASIVAQSVSAEAESGATMLEPDEGFATSPLSPGADLQNGPLTFTLKGKALLIWKVDMNELSEALAGRDEAAFEAIVAAFPGVAEAHARIEPFWKSTFPTDALAIKIKLQEPKPAQ